MKILYLLPALRIILGLMLTINAVQQIKKRKFISYAELATGLWIITGYWLFYASITGMAIKSVQNSKNIKAALIYAVLFTLMAILSYNKSFL